MMNAFRARIHAAALWLRDHPLARAAGMLALAAALFALALAMRGGAAHQAPSAEPAPSETASADASESSSPDSPASADGRDPAAKARDVAGRMSALLATQVDEYTVRQLIETEMSSSRADMPVRLARTEYRLTDLINAAAQGGASAPSDDDLEQAFDDWSDAVWNAAASQEAGLAFQWSAVPRTSLFHDGQPDGDLSPQCLAFKNATVDRPAPAATGELTVRKYSQWRLSLPAMYDDCLANMSDAQRSWNPVSGQVNGQGDIDPAEGSAQ